MLRVVNLVFLGGCLVACLVPGGPAMAQREAFVDTPFGKVPKECHLQHPAGTTLKIIENGVRATHTDGTVKDYISSAKCLEFAKTYKSRRAPSSSPPISNGWFNYAGWLAPANIGNFSATYTLPQPPANPGSQTIYYYIGLQDIDSASPTILQPVASYFRSAWSLTSWNCCPSGTANQGNVVTGMQSGDTVTAAIYQISTSPTTYAIQGIWSGNVTSLNAEAGTANYNWPNVTLEIDNLDTCDQFMTGPFTFGQLSMNDIKGNSLTPSWGVTPSGGTACNGKLTVNGTTITIQQNIP